MKWFTVFSLCLCVFLNIQTDVRSQSFNALNIEDIAQSAIGVVDGVIHTIPDVIPSPYDIFHLGKNVLVGYPFDVVATAVHTFCSAALSKKTVRPRITPDIKSMKFVLYTILENATVPLEDPAALWNNDLFDEELPLVLFVTGWLTNFNETPNDALTTMRKAYACRGGVNFVAVDSAKYVDTLYSWSAFNTEKIGEIIADALQLLIKTYPIEKIHLMGHSLGAHIVGAAGRHLSYKTDKLLPRITGLDPANPCFNEGASLIRLSRGDAEFVDIIHSNPGVLGKRDSIGDADFYPNGLNPLAPGCFTIICAHARSWEFMAESVYPGNENNFLGVKCSSLMALKQNYCPGKKYPMGYAVPHNLKGNFFLSTKHNSPFGEYDKGVRPRCN